MNNPELILKTVTSARPDDATVSAAIDALREDAGESYFGACAAVVAAWRAALDAEQLTQAAALIRHNAPLRRVLMRDIRAFVGVDEMETHTSLIVAGNEAPLARVVMRDVSEPDWGEFLILVGAGWLLEHAKRYSKSNYKTPARNPSPRE